MKHIRPNVPQPSNNPDAHQIRNASIETVEWLMDGLKFTEAIRQDYDGGCVFSGGMVEGHDIDQVYLRWTKDADTDPDGSNGGMLLLTPDELAAIAWVATGVLYSGLISQRIQNDIENEGAKTSDEPNKGKTFDGSIDLDRPAIKTIDL